MSILDNVKEIARAIHEINNPDLYKRVLALHSDIVGLVEEDIQLRDENQKLKEMIRLENVMKFQEPFWYRVGDETPYCPGCWESNAQPVHVIVEWQDDAGKSSWRCPVCKREYMTGGDRYPSLGRSGPY
jgi:hypothetical protein